MKLNLKSKIIYKYVYSIIDDDDDKVAASCWMQVLLEKKVLR